MSTFSFEHMIQVFAMIVLFNCIINAVSLIAVETSSFFNSSDWYFWLQNLFCKVNKK